MTPRAGNKDIRDAGPIIEHQMFPKPQPKVSHKGRRNKGAVLERKVAKLLGGVRTPMSGGSPLGGGDVIAEGWSVECKKRASIPALLRDAFSQAENDISIGDRRRPLVVIEQDRGKPIACLYLDDLVTKLAEQGPDNASGIRNLARKITELADEIERQAR